MSLWAVTGPFLCALDLHSLPEEVWNKNNKIYV